MPYIKPEYRVLYDSAIGELLETLTIDHLAGDLNYVITNLCIGFVNDRENYATMNEVLGVLDAAAKEYYRRKVAPYEDEKIAQNGDLY